MKRRLRLILTVSFVVLLIAPVVVRQMMPPVHRKLNGVRLSETSYREVQFRNDEQGLNLGGLLFVPQGPGPSSAVVFIHGSGTSQRDNAWYLTIAHYLWENGIVVLLPDKRGSEKSEGCWRKSSFNDLATDTQAAVAYLKKQNVHPVSCIGIIGMSQGGNIAPIVASRESDVEFVVSVVGAAIPMFELLYYEENNNLREMGILPGFSHGLAILSSFSIRKFKQKEFWESIGNFDPLDYWKKLKVAGLILYGENDKNVPSLKSAQRLESLNNPLIDARIYKDSGHALESPEGTGDLIFREDAMHDILSFIRKVCK